MLKSKIVYWFTIYLVLYSLLELSKAELCAFCGKEFISVNRHKWRCKEKIHNIHSCVSLPQKFFLFPLLIFLPDGNLRERSNPADAVGMGPIPG